MEIYDESDGRITQALSGREVEYVYREGKELLIYTACGHEIVLQVDINGDIQLKKINVRVIVPSVNVTGEVGRF